MIIPNIFYALHIVVRYARMSVAKFRNVEFLRSCEWQKESNDSTVPSSVQGLPG
jgi:hypothetical protein